MAEVLVTQLWPEERNGVRISGFVKKLRFAVGLILLLIGISAWADTVPGSPVIGLAISGAGQVKVNFTPPANDGGAPITAYTVTSTPGSITATGTASPITVTGLTNGTAYTFKVTATNAVGTGAASAASNSATPGAIGTDTLFTDDFDRPDGPLGTNWVNIATPTYPTCTNPGPPCVTKVENNKQTGNGVARLADSSNFANADYSVQAEQHIYADSSVANADGPNTVAGEILLFARHNGSSTYYYAYARAGDGSGKLTVGIIKELNGTLSQPVYQYISNAGYTTWRFEVAGTALRFYGDENLLLETNDTSISAIGYAGISSYGVLTHASYASDNFVVKGTAAPPAAPGAPVIGNAVGGNAVATVSFTPPANNGSAPITGYTVTATPGDITATGTASPITVTGLTNGTAYTFKVTATNAVGTGAASAASNSVTPIFMGSDILFADNFERSDGPLGANWVNIATPTYPTCTNPGPPCVTKVENNKQTGNGVAILADSSNFANANYSVQAQQHIYADSSVANADGPNTVAGEILLFARHNGSNTYYYAYARAGDGSGKLTVGIIKELNGTLSQPVYQYISNAGYTTWRFEVIGTALRFYGDGNLLLAVNDTSISAIGYAGLSSYGVLTHASYASDNFVVKGTAVVPLTAPGAPVIGNAEGGNAVATVSFTPPASDGGSAITGYTVTSTPGGVTATGTTSPIRVTGLTNGTAYTFTVTATNAIGTGASSAASNSVTPAAVEPDAPVMVGAMAAGNGRATVSFTPPASDGGSPLTGYTVTSNPGGITATRLASPITVMGLTNGTAYTFTVTASNAVGTSVPSQPSNSVVPDVDAQEYYIHTDLLDTPRTITDTEGNVVWQWDNSDPFGNNSPDENPAGLGTFVNNLGFPGQYRDKETNTFYNAYRDAYDPALGRYTQSDPIGLYGGINGFIYADGNPLSRADPTGLDWIYLQSTGQIFNQPPASAGGGPPVPIGKGYAGQNAGLNNPANQSVAGAGPNSNGGPLPQGTYDIGFGHYSPSTGPNTMNLSPQPGTNTFGRDLFRIHGDNAAHNNTASEGCIVAGPNIRNQINNSTDRVLQVVP